MNIISKFNDEVANFIKKYVSGILGLIIHSIILIVGIVVFTAIFAKVCIFILIYSSWIIPYVFALAALSLIIYLIIKASDKYKDN